MATEEVERGGERKGDRGDGQEFSLLGSWSKFPVLVLPVYDKIDVRRSRSGRRTLSRLGDVRWGRLFDLDGAARDTDILQEEDTKCGFSFKCSIGSEVFAS